MHVWYTHNNNIDKEVKRPKKTGKGKRIWKGRGRNDVRSLKKKTKQKDSSLIIVIFG